MQTPFILGWEEWLALPELGLPAIKAKVDTGARTSALHAFLIEPFGPASAPMVRFGIHPIPGRDEIEVYCSAPVIDRREVTSSNGERETRFVISSRVRIGERDWPIELTLTNREAMAYRMLLGRQAIRDDMFVDPAASFRQPRLSYKLYRHLPRLDPVRRALRIAVLTRVPAAASNAQLAAAAAARGHVLEVIDVGRLALSFEAGAPALLDGGAVLPHYDAVIPRLAARRDRAGAAAVRQLELTGSHAINSGDALDRLASRMATIQALVRAGIPPAEERVSLTDPAPRVGPPAEAGPVLVAYVVGGSTLALMERRLKRLRDLGDRRRLAARRLAERAARALRLELATIEIVPGSSGAPGGTIGAVSALPSLARAHRVAGIQAAEAVIGLVEREVRSWVRRDVTPADGAADEPEVGDDAP